MVRRVIAMSGSPLADWEDEEASLALPPSIRHSINLIESSLTQFGTAKKICHFPIYSRFQIQ